ncbi:hypothetical protein LY622_05940 [Halomonas sp. M5N1S17]|uniref:hypothetical protein n=1 Tax=Halomonas alkalisoli TaxID=2907158 RepID=UPI001F37C1B9|nr:hypothetical protein [Halomonas alkalisoli]MCE9662976.1 hypothetical protein [Halomonas alkalisoli]
MKLAEIETQLNMISKMLKVSLQLGMGIGLLIILIYSGGVGYYPSGLTVGDGILLIAVALVFGLVYSVVVLLLFCVSIIALRQLRKLGVPYFNKNWFYNKVRNIPREGEESKFLPLTKGKLKKALRYNAVTIFALLALIVMLKDLLSIKEVVSSVVLMTVFYLIWDSIDEFCEESEEKKKSKSKISVVFVLVIYLIPVINAAQFGGNLIANALSLIGVRNESATVQFKDDYRKFVESEVGQEDNRIYKASLLLHGLGANSVLEINKKRFVVPSSQYFIMYE